MGLDVSPAVQQSAGIGRYARELGRALLARGQWPYVLFAAGRPGSGDQGGGDDFGPAAPAIRWTGLPARWHAIWWQRFGLPPSPEWWTGPLAIFHSLDFLAPPVRHARLVVTLHDLSFLVHPERAHPAVARLLTARVPRIARRAQHVVADSAHTRRDIITLLGLAEAQVTVAYPGIGAAFRRPRRAEELAAVRQRYRLQGPFVLGVGTLEPRKDWPVLIAAFQDAGPALADHDLVIAGGPGWGLEPIYAAARAGGERVRLLGFVPDQDLPALYSLASAFAYPSVYEGFGLPPLEAMACGTPTIVSDASCLPEVVGQAAEVVAVGDTAALAAALVRVVVDRDRCRWLAEQGPARAAAFTWEACAAAVETVYAGLATAPLIRG